MRIIDRFICTDVHTAGRNIVYLKSPFLKLAVSNTTAAFEGITLIKTIVFHMSETSFTSDYDKRDSTRPSQEISQSLGNKPM
jgi:hypothetical protein